MTYHLAIFGADDQLLVDVPLTEEQATILKASLPTRNDPDVFGSYPVFNVFFEADRDE